MKALPPVAALRDSAAAPAVVETRLTRSLARSGLNLTGNRGFSPGLPASPFGDDPLSALSFVADVGPTGQPARQFGPGQSLWAPTGGSPADGEGSSGRGRMREGGGGGGSPGFFPPSGSGDDGSGFTLLSLNNPPVANNDEYSVTEDNTLNVTAPGVLGNDTDLDSDPLAAVLVSGPANGTLTLNTNGSFTYTPNADYSGTDSFTYKANDGQDDSNVATVTITVNPVNDAPLVFNPGGQANAPNDTVSRYVLVYEADGDPVTFSATGLPPGLSIDSASGEITGTIASSAEAGSPYTVTVTASDGTLTDSETFTWTVGYVELLNPGNQHNVVEDDIWLPLTAFDRDGEPLTFSAAGLPPGLSIDTATGEIIGTISSTADAGSPYAVTVTAAHGGHSASQTFNWTVARVGVVNPGDQHSATGDTLSLWVAARAGSGQTLSYSATGLPPGLAMNSDTGEISGTVAATADSGSPYTVTVGVSAGAYSDSATFAWKVTRVLVENPGYQSNYAGDVVSLPVAARANGGPAPQYSATGMPAGLSIDAGTGVISGTVAATAYQQSPHTVTVTATSGTYSDSQTFTWVVSNPIAVANPGDQNNARGDAVYLPIVATSAGTGSLSYSATGLPAGLSINAATGEITGGIDQSADAGSPYTVTVTAQSGALSASQSFVWTVRPVLVENPGNQEHAVGDFVSLTISARGSLGGAYTFGASGLPPGLTMDANTGVISGTLSGTADSVNTYTVTVTAQLGADIDSQTFLWKVARVLVQGGGSVYHAHGDSVMLPIVARTNGPDPLTYSATGLPGGLSVNSSTGLITGTVSLPAQQNSRVYTATVSASAGGHSDSQTVYWFVSRLQVGDPGDQHHVPGDEVSLPITVTGVPHGASLNYTADGLPPGLSIDSNGVITGTIDADADLCSPYTATVTAATGQGATASVTFPWVVTHLRLSDPADRIYVPGEEVAIQLEVSYHGTRPLVYSATGLPASLSINATTGLISGVISAGDVADDPYQVQVTVQDDLGHSDTQLFALAAKDVKVTFSKEKIITGFVYDGMNIRGLKSETVVGTISDKNQFANYRLGLSGQKRHQSVNTIYDPATGTWTTNAYGESATPANKPEGDEWLAVYKKDDFFVGKEVSPKVPIIVVVPTSLVQPKPAPVVVVAENIIMDERTSPADPDVPRQFFIMATWYGTKITMTVLDQFGKPLDAVYEGTPITESRLAAPDKKVAINVNMTAAGTYLDAVGFQDARVDPQTGKLLVFSDMRDVEKAKDWVKPDAMKSPLPRKPLVREQRLAVQVGGHELNPAIHRVVTLTPDPNDQFKGTLVIEPK